MITLDEIIPYQPPSELPPKPSQHFQYTQPSFSPPFSSIHPLPPRPSLPLPPPAHPSLLSVTRGVSPSINVFDEELASLDAIIVKTNQVVGLKQPAIEPHKDIPDSNGRRDIPQSFSQDNEQTPKSSKFLGLSQHPTENTDISVVSAACADADQLRSESNGTGHGAETACDKVPDDGIVDATSNITISHEDFHRQSTNHSSLHDADNEQVDLEAENCVPDGAATASTMLDNGYEKHQAPNKTSRAITAVRPDSDKGQSTPRLSEQGDPPPNHSIAVVIPASEAVGSQNRTRAGHRVGRRKRKSRFMSSKDTHTDDKNNNDDYVDVSENMSDQHHPIKRRRLPAVHTGPSQSKTAARSPMGGFSLPDLNAISRGILTCEIFESEVLYSFTWSVERNPTNHPDYTVRDLQKNTYEKNNTRASMSRTTQMTTRVNVPFTEEEDELLKRLKEKDELTWKEIKKHFPRRSQGTLQVRYSNKLKDQASEPSRSTTREAESDAGSSSISKHDRISCRQHSARAETVPSFRSRYGPPRSRHATERYSPS